MANRIEMKGIQDPWLSGQIGLLSLGKVMYVLFSGIGVRYGCPQDCIYIYIYIRIAFRLLGSFWRLVPLYFHGRSRPSGTTSSMARWRPSNPLLRKHACFWPFQSLRRCALLMNKAWLRNHRRFRNRDLETTAQELPFRNYGSCTKVQELWLEKDFQRFRLLRLGGIL